MIQKVVMVAPGPEYSTLDVHDGLVAGLRHAGVLVHCMKFHNRLKYHREATHLLHDAGISQRAISNEEAAMMAGEDVLATVMRQDPDVVLVVTGGLLNPEIPLILQERGYPTFVVLTESPYEWEVDAFIAKHYTGAICNEPTCQDDIIRLSGNENVIYLPHAYNPAVHSEPAVDPEHVCDVVMVGTGFEERIKLLEAVDWTGIDLRLYGTWHMTAGTSLEKYWRTPGAHDDMMSGAVDNKAVPALYRNAKICLNIHRTTRYALADEIEHIDRQAYACNPRVFEVMACGGVLLTDHRPEIDVLFGPGGGSVLRTFRDAQGLKAQVDALLADATERDMIRKRALEAIQPHSYYMKAWKVLQFMESCLAGESAGEAIIEGEEG